MKSASRMSIEQGLLNHGRASSLALVARCSSLGETHKRRGTYAIAFTARINDQGPATLWNAITAMAKE
jgi:hypothetical protein